MFKVERGGKERKYLESSERCTLRDLQPRERRVREIGERWGRGR